MPAAAPQPARLRGCFSSHLPGAPPQGGITPPARITGELVVRSCVPYGYESQVACCPKTVAGEAACGRTGHRSRRDGRLAGASARARRGDPTTPREVPKAVDPLLSERQDLQPSG